MRPRLSGKEYRPLSKKPSGRRKKLKRRLMTCYLISKRAWGNDDNNECLVCATFRFYSFAIVRYSHVV